MPKTTQLPSMVKPIRAMPNSLPSISSQAVIELNSTSTMRFDFSSTVLFSSICETEKMATNRR